MSDYCSESSAEAGEALAGTAAAETEIWILLEFAHNWAAKPLECPDLAGRARETLEEWLQVPGSRFQLVRQPRSKRKGPFSLFIGRSSSERPWIVKFELDSYEEIAKFSLEDIVAQNGHPAASVVEGPIQLVCTHGKRDRCCAKYGMGLFAAMAEINPDAVWQTSHLGGHRFAATSLSLPYGINYGRLTAGDAKGLMSAQAAQRIYDLDKTRGRTCYSGPAQAAEIFIRKREGELSYGALHLEGAYETGDNSWVVVFRRPSGEVSVNVERVSSGAMRIESCALADSQVEIMSYREAS